MTEQRQVVQIDLRFAQVGPQHLFANDLQQITVLVEVAIHIIRDGIFFMRALTEEERRSVRLRSWSPEVELFLPLGWSSDSFRNDYMQGSPDQEGIGAPEVAVADPANFVAIIPCNLRTSRSESQRFMAVVDIEGSGTVTTYSTGPALTISSVAPLVIPARDLLRRDQLVVHDVRAGNHTRLFIVSYFDFVYSRIQVSIMRFYTGIVSYYARRLTPI